MRRSILFTAERQQEACAALPAAVGERFLAIRSNGAVRSGGCPESEDDTRNVERWIVLVMENYHVRSVIFLHGVVVFFHLPSYPAYLRSAFVCITFLIPGHPAGFA